MNLLEVDVRNVRSTGIPEELVKRCRPGESVFKLTVTGDASVIPVLEEMTYEKTNRYPTIGNDIRSAGIRNRSSAARVAHALEHGTVLHLVDVGRIDLATIEFHGEIALAGSGYAADGSTFGMFWLKENVVGTNDTICALETFVEEFNEQQRGENVIRLK